MTNAAVRDGTAINLSVLVQTADLDEEADDTLDLETIELINLVSSVSGGRSDLKSRCSLALGAMQSHGCCAGQVDERKPSIAMGINAVQEHRRALSAPIEDSLEEPSMRPSSSGGPPSAAQLAAVRQAAARHGNGSAPHRSMPPAWAKASFWKGADGGNV